MEIDVKKILVKPIQAKYANDFIKKNHYSGKKVNNSILHFGCFYNEVLHGVLSFGSPLDKRKVLGLVTNTKWNEMLELNRMAFDNFLPKNSESRCISICIRLIKKHYAHIKWILSFADATQCGDGTIYRASGFALTAIRKSVNDLWTLPETLHYLNKGNPTIHRMTIQCKTSKISEWCIKKYKNYNVPLAKLVLENGGQLTNGFQFRYIYLIDKKEKITVPIIPFSKIQEMGAGMYKGVKKCGSSVTGSTVSFQDTGNVQINSTAL